MVFLTKGLCVTDFNSFNLAEYKDELSGREDDVFFPILIHDRGNSCENQQEAVVSNTIGGLGVSALLCHKGDGAKINEV